MDGLDVDAVRAHGAGLKAQAQHLDGIAQAISAIVSQAESLWHGREATDFAGWWNQQHRPALLAAAHAVAGLGTSAINNADEQARASSASGASAGGTGAVAASAGVGAAAGAGAAVAGTAAALASYSRGPQNVSNSQIAAAAERELQQNPGQLATGWNQPGECMTSAQRWVEAAGGTVNRNGEVAGSYSGVSAQVPLAQAQRGDIIQYVDPANPNGDWAHVHTVVVVGGNPTSGFTIIERNYDLKGSIREVSGWQPHPAAGWEARAYRYGNQP